MVKKVVVDDNGGSKIATDFSFKVNAGAPVQFQQDTDHAARQEQRSARTPAATRSPSPPPPATRRASPTTRTPTRTATTLNVGNGQTVICTITNNDQAGTLIVKKTVVGGTKHATDFSFKVNAGASITFIQDGDQLHGKNTLVENAGPYSVVEDAMSGYAATYTNDQNANTNCTNLTVGNGQTVTCTITNTIADNDSDGIPNNIDCNREDDEVVDPNNVTGLPPAKRFNTLQAAVNAAADNYAISMYANTNENVTINNTRTC